MNQARNVESRNKTLHLRTGQPQNAIFQIE